jgi:uncharacterized protein
VTEPAPPRLVVSVTEIRRRLGSRLDVHRTLPAAGVALSDVSVPDGADIVLDAEAESIANGVVLTGTVSVPWVGSCRRCLDPVTGTATVDIREVYEARPVEGETWPLEGDHIDVGPLLHDSALLALPLAPLCGPECRGPAPDALPVGVEGEDGTHPAHDDGDDGGDGDGDDGDRRPLGDPRWAALDDLDL